jgi:hypothetical protein
MTVISQKLRRVEEYVPEEEVAEYTPEDDVVKAELKFEAAQVGDAADHDEMNDEDAEDDDDDGEDDDEDEDDDEEEDDVVESGEVVGDDLALQILEEELDEVEDFLSPEDLDELEQLLTTPEQGPDSLENAEGDDGNWDTHDDQVLSQPYEFPSDDNILMEHDAIGSDDGVAPASDLKTVSIHKNGTYILILIALVFGIGLFSKFCGRKDKKDRRHIVHKRLNTDDDYSA